MTSHTIYLHRIEPAHNCYRYYSISLEPGLFKEWCLTRSWGRMGTKGRHLIVWFTSRELAQEMVERTRRAKLRRGYQPTLFPLAVSYDVPTPYLPDAMSKTHAASHKPTPRQRTILGQQELFSL